MVDTEKNIKTTAEKLREVLPNGTDCNYINGEYVRAVDGHTLDDLNPRNG